MEAVFVVVGGGIAGVSCAESLSILDSNCSIILISESALIKRATNLVSITRTLINFEVKEDKFSDVSNNHPNITILHDTLLEINEILHMIHLESGLQIKYNYLCICTGASPKLIPQAVNIPQILGIRDTDSIDNLITKMKKSKRIAIVGNGGIATELIYQIKDIETHWIIKDKHISSTFVDAGAAEFFQHILQSNEYNSEKEPTVSKRMKYTEEYSTKSGAALGPDWYKNLTISGKGKKQIIIHYENEINSIAKTSSGQVEITLTNGEQLEIDLVVSATGVEANLDFKTQNQFELSSEGFINVDEFMRTSLKDVYAAGDVCNANWDHAKHWFQMKLWTQARQMGSYAAKCMLSHSKHEDVYQDFCFEIFAHSTKLFGYKAIMLGLFNGQKLENNYEILLRMTKGMEYVKFVMVDGKLQGALLIGDTDLEEMCENLILNQLDLTPYGDDILNPNIDIEDYFD